MVHAVLGPAANEWRGLFVWQFVLSGPLEIASGYIGFAQYLSYFWRSMSPLESKLVALGLAVLVVVLNLDPQDFTFGVSYHFSIVKVRGARALSYHPLAPASRGQIQMPMHSRLHRPFVGDRPFRRSP